jgi:hypothetical protein
MKKCFHHFILERMFFLQMMIPLYVVELYYMLHVTMLLMMLPLDMDAARFNHVGKITSFHFISSHFMSYISLFRFFSLIKGVTECVLQLKSYICKNVY